MEINFIFSTIQSTIKCHVNKNDSINEHLKKIMDKDESLKNKAVNFILCGGEAKNIMESFTNNKIKNGDAIMVMIKEDSDESFISETESLFQFKVQKCISMHSHVNLENADLNAFIDRTFTVFKSIKNEFLLIFAYSKDYKNYSIICYNILQDNIKKIIPNYHSERVFTCDHYYDKFKKRDLLLTGSFDKTIKVSDINNNFNIIYKLKPNYIFVENTYLLSEALLLYDNKIYLIVSAYEINSSGYNMLYYDLSENDYNSLKKSKDNTNYLDIFYEKNIPYIIAGNCGNVKIFNFANKKLIREFKDNNDSINYLSVIIMRYKDKSCIFVSSSDGFLRIWDINEKNLIEKITIYSNHWLIGLELLNNRFLLAACSDGSLKQFDLEKNYVARTLNRNNYNDPLFTVKYININGEDYLFTHSHKGLIELWK